MMTSTLRLPDDLAALARARGQRLGISLNALVCVALDAYLGPAGGVSEAPASAPASAQLSLPQLDPGEVIYHRPMTKNERKRLAALAKRK